MSWPRLLPLQQTAGFNSLPLVPCGVTALFTCLILCLAPKVYNKNNITN